MATPDEIKYPLQLREYFIPHSYNHLPYIQVLPVEADQYEIKSSIIQILSSFCGLNREDPYKHLNEFLEICFIVRIHNFYDDTLMLKLFLFSLTNRAKYWLNILESITIST